MSGENDERRRTAALAKLSAALEAVGFPHGMARVYAALTLAPGEGLSSSELVDGLRISRASVSNATQFLVGTEMVERYRVPGSRETHYRILKDAWGPLLLKKFALTATIARTVDEAMAYTDAQPARERLEEMRDVYAFFEEQFAHIVNAWNERMGR